MANRKKKGRRAKKRPILKTKEQIAELRRSYALKAYPKASDIKRIQKKIDLPYKSIQEWFQTQRTEARLNGDISQLSVRSQLTSGTRKKHIRFSPANIKSRIRRIQTHREMKYKI